MAILLAMLLMIQLAAYPAAAAEADVTFTLGTVSGNPGDTVSVALSMESSVDIDAVGIAEVVYDTAAFTFEGFADFGSLITDSLTGSDGVDMEKGTIVFAYMSAGKLSGKICSLRFCVKPDAKRDEYPISYSCIVKNGAEKIERIKKETGWIAVTASEVPTQTSPPTDAESSGSVSGETELCRHLRTEMSMGVPADCTKNGFSAGVFCKDCGKYLSGHEVIPAKPHSFGEWHLAEGKTDEQTRSCTVCGLIQSKSIFLEEKQYRDVHANDWFYSAVRYVTSHAIMNGMEGDVFSPSTTTTRAMVAQILYNMEGRPQNNGKNAFREGNGKWYSEAVTWAAESGIVCGLGDGSFGAELPITREQFIVMLHRYAKVKGRDVSVQSVPRFFADSDKVSGYAREAMEWAISNGLVTGNGENRIDPQGSALRCQIAAIIVRLNE